VAEEIAPEELKARLDRRDPIVLVDVRDDWEVRLCALDNALHIPMPEIEFRTEELNPADQIVVYCHQGVRSAAVADYLRAMGFAKVWNLAGGVDAWARRVDPSMRRY
jgi:rhodanese-related sulfurtransferase